MSNRLVPDNLWEMTMGDMPKPEGVTFDEMHAMYDVVWKIEQKEYAVEQIKWYEDFWRRELPKYKYKELHKDDSQEAMESYKIQSDTMRMIKEGILMYRGWLAE